MNGKKKIWIAWHSKESDENAGCWYDSMKIKVFDSRKKADDYVSRLSGKEGETVYCSVVCRELKLEAE